MICDNEMCFDLTEKHPEEKKNAISRSSHQTASTLLFVCFLLFCVRLNWVTLSAQTSHHLRKKKKNSFSESVFKLNTK